MLCYHNTYKAPEILEQGFRDATGYYLTKDLHTGVWLSDVPLDANEGAGGDILLAIEIPEEVLTPFEWVGGMGYREFLIPAEVVNRYGPPRVHGGDYAGCKKEALLFLADRFERDGSPHLRKRAARIRETLPFLERHGLVCAAEEAVDEV
jgi:hypothetical protein